MYKIYIVEDTMVLAESIRKHLTNWGYEAYCVADFRAVLTEFVELNPALVLMDITLPFYSGYYWCAEIRKISKVPIVFLSSASDNMNIVMAMNMGGDDFIAKPFDIEVLTAKVQAILRRTYDFSAKTQLMEHRGVILNLQDATLTYQGQKVELTKNDFKMIQLLMENKGKTVSRDDIMNRLWETDSFVDENTLTVNMARLRKKLELAGIQDYIITKKGLGYLISDDE